MSVATYNSAVSYALDSNNRTSWDKGVSGNLFVIAKRLTFARLNFLEAGLEGVLDAVHNLALTIFRTVLSATVGILFTDKVLRDRAWGSFGEFTGNIGGVFKSSIGVIYPALAANYLK